MIATTQAPGWTAPRASEGWDQGLVPGGGSLRAIDPLVSLDGEPRDGLDRRLGQLLLAVHEPRPAGSEAEPGVRAVAAAGRRILQRGRRPAADPDTEKELLRRSKLSDLRPSGLPGDLSLRAGPRTVLPAADRLLAAAAWNDLAAKPAVDCQGPPDRFFKWVCGRCGDAAARWLTVSEPAGFLFAPPWRAPVLIRLEAERPAQPGAGEDARPHAPTGVGVERVPAAEVMALQGPALDRLVRILKPPAAGEADREVLTLVYGPALATWLGLAVMEAVERQWLRPGRTWKIRLADPLGLGECLVRPILELVAALDGLFAAGLSPDRCEVARGRDKPFALVRTGPAAYSRARPGAAFRAPDVEVLLEPDRGPIDPLPGAARHPLVVARASALPGAAPAAGRADSWPAEIVRDLEVLEPCLGRLLAAVFAKESFREGQLAALSRVLCGRDCLAHLPSGGGKSLIYQMAGLLRPGTTVVIEPDARLVDDQVRGLRRVGARRVRVLGSDPAEEDGEDGGGEALFCFLAAEMLRREGPREVLAELAAASRLGLVVVDEAHAASEWSHDFRLSYQAVRPFLGQAAGEASAGRPPVLALTGTASRRVARDIVTVLAGGGDPDAVVRAASLHRSELGFEVLEASTERAHRALVDHLRRLPKRFDMPEARFFAPGGGERPQGMVFCAAATGPLGATEVWRRLARRLGAEVVGLWAPSPPEGMPRREFERQRSTDLRSFRRGELPLLVTTPELGIGLSIPDVRYVVHVGFPGPLEAYAQQAGRAGHDGRPARCAILSAGRSSPQVERILDPGLGGRLARAALREAGGPPAVEADLGRHLERHFAAFPGREVEMAGARDLLDLLEWDGEARQMEVPAGGEEPGVELALYRLSLLGIVTAWTRPGEGALRVSAASASAHDLDAALLRFVERTRPSRELEIQERLASLRSPSLRGHAESLAEAVLDLVYEAIEPARRASLRDMWRLVSAAASPRELAREVDAGLLVERLEPRILDLLRDGGTALSGWLELLVELTVQDAGELEAAVARSLAEHPGHPGLLLAATAARLFRQESRADFFAGIEAFTTAARQGDAVAWPDLRPAAIWLTRRAREVAPSWAIGPWLAWEEAGGPLHLLRAEEMASLRDEAQAPAESVVVLARRLNEAVAIAGSLGEHFQIEAADV